MIRLITLTLENVRGTAHREVNLCGDTPTGEPHPDESQLRGVTVVAGANEAGKSTIVDALHCLLEFFDNATRKEVRSLQTTGNSAAPIITATLRIGPHLLRYRKRFVTQTETVLEILSPKPEKLTGREAHDRVRALIKEHVDLAMWQRLRLTQGQAPSNDDLHELPSLQHALSTASGTTAITDSELALVTRVRDTQHTLLTKGQRRPTGELRQANERIAQLEAEHQQLQDRLEALEEAIDEATAIEARLPEQRHALTTREHHVDNHARVLAGLELAVQQRETADLRVARSRSTIEELEQEQQRRHTLEEHLATFTARRDEFAARCVVLRHHLKEAQARQEQRGAEQQRLQRQQARVHGQLRMLELTEQRQALSGHLATIDEQLEELDRLDTELARLREQHATVGIDEAGFTALEELDRQRRDARAAQRAARARLEVQALTPLRVTTGDDERLTLEPGERWTSEARGTLAVRLDDVADLRLLSADDERLRAAVEQADAAFAQHAESLGVTDLDDARAAITCRRELAPRLAHLEQDHARRHEQHDAATLRDRAQQLRETLDGLTDTSADDSADPERRAGLDADNAQLTQALTEIAAAIDAEDHEVIVATRDALGKLEGQDEELARSIETTVQTLDEQRAARSDEELTQQLERARHLLGEHVQAAEAAVERLEGVDVDAHRQQAAELTAELERQRAAVSEDEMKLVERRAYIDARSGEGLAEKLAELEGALQHTTGKRDGLERQARSAAFLVEVLDEEVERASRTHAAPLREVLITYGRHLYGSAFDIELDEQLRIARRYRTDDEGWLEHEVLSVGAKEQLALLVRLACAQLLGEQGGLVIIDDALGNTDRVRTQRLGAVFEAAGKHSQVLVLTCDETRYDALPSARRLTL